MFQEKKSGTHTLNQVGLDYWLSERQVKRNLNQLMGRLLQILLDRYF